MNCEIVKDLWDLLESNYDQSSKKKSHFYRKAISYDIAAAKSEGGHFEFHGNFENVNVTCEVQSFSQCMGICMHTESSFFSNSRRYSFGIAGSLRINVHIFVLLVHRSRNPQNVFENDS